MWSSSRCRTAAPSRVSKMGLVISVWRGIKAPKLFSGSTNVSSCVAFRVVVLDMEENSDAPLCLGNVVTP